jgi:hypothetical protein
MKKIHKTLLASAILALAFTSCTKTGPTGPAGATGATGSTGPNLSGTLEGYVDLFDQYGDLMTPATGVHITIPTLTSVHDSTTSSGMFQIPNLTTGTYELDFNKTGYGTTKVNSLNFTGGGTQYVQAHVQLTQVPSFTLTSIAVGTSTVATNPAITVTVTPGSSDTKARKAIVFFSNASTVSYTPGNYSGFQVVNIPATSTVVTTNIGASATLYPAGATSGSTLYLIAYPISYNSGASTYADIATGKTVFNNLLTTSPVATQTVVVP